MNTKKETMIIFENGAKVIIPKGISEKKAKEILIKHCELNTRYKSKFE